MDNDTKSCGNVVEKDGGDIWMEVTQGLNSLEDVIRFLHIGQMIYGLHCRVLLLPAVLRTPCEPSLLAEQLVAFSRTWSHATTRSQFFRLGSGLQDPQSSQQE